MENSGDVRSFVELQWNKFIDRTSKSKGVAIGEVLDIDF